MSLELDNTGKRTNDTYQCVKTDLYCPTSTTTTTTTTSRYVFNHKVANPVPCNYFFSSFLSSESTLDDEEEKDAEEEA